MSHVEIHLSPDPSSEYLHLDGEDISRSVAAFTIQHVAGHAPRLVVDFAMGGSINLSGETEVVMSLATTNLLRRAGWTPPADSHGGTDPITFKRDDDGAPGGPGRGETDEQAGGVA